VSPACSWSPCSTKAQNRPQWRGPNRDGISSAFSEPRARPEKLKLKWKVNVGEGHSSPVVADGSTSPRGRATAKWSRASEPKRGG